MMQQQFSSPAGRRRSSPRQEQTWTQPKHVATSALLREFPHPQGGTVLAASKSFGPRGTTASSFANQQRSSHPSRNNSSNNRRLQSVLQDIESFSNRILALPSTPNAIRQKYMQPTTTTTNNNGSGDDHHIIRGSNNHSNTPPPSARSGAESNLPPPPDGESKVGQFKSGGGRMHSQPPPLTTVPPLKGMATTLNTSTTTTAHPYVTPPSSKYNGSSFIGSRGGGGGNLNASTNSDSSGQQSVINLAVQDTLDLASSTVPRAGHSTAEGRHASDSSTGGDGLKGTTRGILSLEDYAAVLLSQGPTTQSPCTDHPVSKKTHSSSPPLRSPIIIETRGGGGTTRLQEWCRGGSPASITPPNQVGGAAEGVADEQVGHRYSQPPDGKTRDQPEEEDVNNSSFCSNVSVLGASDHGLEIKMMNPTTSPNPSLTSSLRGGDNGGRASATTPPPHHQQQPKETQPPPTSPHSFATLQHDHQQHLQVYSLLHSLYQEIGGGGGGCGPSPQLLSTLSALSFVSSQGTGSVGSENQNPSINGSQHGAPNFFTKTSSRVRIGSTSSAAPPPLHGPPTVALGQGEEEEDSEHHHPSILCIPANEVRSHGSGLGIPLSNIPFHVLVAVNNADNNNNGGGGGESQTSSGAPTRGVIYSEGGGGDSSGNASCAAAAAAKAALIAVLGSPSDSLLSTDHHHNDGSNNGSGMDSQQTLRRLSVKEGPLAQRGEDEMGFETINNYAIMQELGRGNFGKVMLACDEDGHQVAIKTMDCGVKAPKHRFAPQGFSSVGFNGQHHSSRSRAGSVAGVLSPQTSPRPSPRPQQSDSIVMREVAIMKKLRHKNIVQLREVIHDEEEDQTHLVMDYICQGAMAEVQLDGTCQSQQHLAHNLKLAKDYLKQAANGLEYLHRQEIVHRDVKPENVLVGSNEDVYLADFGVSAVLREDKVVDMTAGTQMFFSPELCRGNYEEAAKYGKQSDIWALGVTFYAVIYGKVPFFAANMMALAHSIMKDPLTFPKVDVELYDRGGGCDGGSTSHTSTTRADLVLLQEIFTGLLQKDPRKRWSLRDLRHALEGRRRAKSKRRKTILSKKESPLGGLVEEQAEEETSSSPLPPPRRRPSPLSAGALSNPHVKSPSLVNRLRSEVYYSTPDDDPVPLSTMISPIRGLGNDGTSPSSATTPGREAVGAGMTTPHSSGSESVQTMGFAENSTSSGYISGAGGSSVDDSSFLEDSTQSLDMSYVGGGGSSGDVPIEVTEEEVQTAIATSRVAFYRPVFQSNVAGGGALVTVQSPTPQPYRNHTPNIPATADHQEEQREVVVVSGGGGREVAKHHSDPSLRGEVGDGEAKWVE